MPPFAVSKSRIAVGQHQQGLQALGDQLGVSGYNVGEGQRLQDYYMDEFLVDQLVEIQTEGVAKGHWGFVAQQ